MGTCSKTFTFLHNSRPPGHKNTYGKPSWASRTFTIDQIFNRPFWGGFLHVLGLLTLSPNFAEITARGARGLLVTHPKDSDPPGGHGATGAGGEPRGAKNRKTKGANPVKNQTFGIELEMRHISRSDAARVIAAHFGTRVSHTGGTYDTREIPDGTPCCTPSRPRSATTAT